MRQSTVPLEGEPRKTSVIIPLTTLSFIASIICGILLVRKIVDYPWRAVPCTIVSSEVVADPQSNDPNLRYEGKVGFKCTDPSTTYFHFKYFADQARAQELANYYTAGSRVEGYHHSSGGSPVLVRAPFWSFLPYLIPFPLFLAGARTLKKRDSSIKRSQPSYADDTDRPVRHQPERNAPVLGMERAVSHISSMDSNRWLGTSGQAVTEGPSVLKSRRWLIAAGFLALAIVSIGISAVLGFTVYNAWKSGEALGCAALVSVFLGLLSFGVLRVSIQKLLSFVNPPPRVEIGSRSVWPGTTLDLGWSYEGRIGTARHLIFSLAGKEKVKMIRKTSKGQRVQTNSSPFAKVVLYETRIPQEIREGRTRIRIPEDLMHSFELENCRIDWDLAVEVELAFWADVSQEYPILIRPGRINTR